MGGASAESAATPKAQRSLLHSLTGIKQDMNKDVSDSAQKEAPFKSGCPPKSSRLVDDVSR